MARPHPALIDIAADRQIGRQDVDPDRLIVSAMDHRMIGLVNTRFRSGELEFPPGQAERLVALGLRSEGQQHLLWRGLKEVVSRLADLGVEVANFKGVTAGARWYDTMGERPCDDIDLYLPPQHHHRINDIVGAFDKSHPLAGRAQDLALTGHIQHVDLRFAPGINLDVHFDPFKLYFPSRQRREVWDRCRTLSTPAGDVKVFDPETALVQLLLHMNKDRFSLLLTYADIVRIVARETIDWDDVWSLAFAEGLETHVFSALRAVFDDLQLPAPLQSSRPGGWRARLWERLWGPETRLGGLKARVSHHRRQFWISLTARGRFREAVTRVGRIAFPTQEMLEHHHPGARGPYLWRLLSGRLRRSSEREQRRRLASEATRSTRSNG